MTTGRCVLSEMECEVEGMLTRLERMGRCGLRDDLATFRRHLLEELAAESEEGSAA